MSYLNNPAVHNLSMSLLKGLINSMSGDKQKTSKEVEELKHKVEQLTKEKDLKNAELLSAKNKELSAAEKKNQLLEKEACLLKKKLGEMQAAGQMSVDLLKEKDKLRGKLAVLENEVKEMKAHNEVKVNETDVMRKKFEEQKKNNQDLNDVVLKLAKMVNSSDSNPSGSNSVDTAECFKQLQALLEKSPINPEQKSKKTKNKNNQNVKTSKEGEKSRNSQQSTAAHNMNKAGRSTDNILPQLMSLPGPSNYVPHQNSPRYPNMAGPPLMHGHFQPPAYAPNYPPPQLYGPPPHTMGNTLFSPTAPLDMPNNYQQSQWQHPFQPNIVNEPNNFGNQNKGDFKNKPMNKDTNKNEEQSNRKKSGVSYDLWGQLENLKHKIKSEKKCTRQELCSEVSTMMANVPNSKITSKENFMVELSECLKMINKIPEGGNSNEPGPYNRRNFKTDFKKNYKKTKDFTKPLNVSSDGQGRGGGTNSYNKNRTNFNRGRGGGFSRNPDNKLPQNSAQDNKCEESDDNNDTSSLCSEPAYQGNYQGGRGRGHGRGRGRGRGFYKQHQRGCKQSSSGGNNIHGSKSVENLNVDLSTLTVDSEKADEQPDSPVPSSSNESKTTEKNDVPTPLPRKINKKPKKSLESDEQEENSGEPYADDDILQMFIGSDIPTLMDAIMQKIDVTLKVKNCLLIATQYGKVVNEKPESLLDIIQFKQIYPDGICVLE